MVVPISKLAFGFAITCLAGAASCASESTPSGGTASGGSAAASGGSGGSAAAAGGPSGGSGGSMVDASLKLDATTGDGAVARETECDGIDNDANGVIDDVDMGKDGICDCLRIATLGLAGTWGGGNVFAAWLDSRSSAGAVDLGDKVLTPELLQDFQVVVAQDLSKMNRTFSSDEVKALGDWVRAGGGLMTLVGYGDPTEITNVNTLLAEFGMSYGSQPILPKQGGATIPITEWTAHPVTTGVTKVGVDNGYPVEGAGMVLASEQGFTLLRVRDVQQGKVLSWGDEWITYNTEWTDHADYQVELFWLNAIKWLTPANECQVPIPPPVH